MLNFSRTDFDSAKIHRVISAPQCAPVTVGQLHHTVSMTPQGLTTRPVRDTVEINLVMILIEQRCGKANGRRYQKKFTHIRWTPSLIKNGKIQSQGGGVESSRHTRSRHGSCNVAA